MTRPAEKAELLALTLVAGGFGAHKYYLGKRWQGILYFLFSWTLIPAFIALIEFVIYVFTRHETIEQETRHLGAGITAAVIGYAGFVTVGYVALTAQNDFRHRARVSTGVMSLAHVRSAVDDYYARNKRLPGDMNELGKLPPDSQRERVALGADGVLTVTFPPGTGDLAGKTVTMSPTADADGTLRWKCRGTVDNRYRPASCRD